MLEGLATWVLNNYLGKYLENLNAEQLSIGLLQGEVELENIPLRRDALRQLDVGLEVRVGFVGKIRLEIPVRRLWSEPWIITLEQIYIVAGPLPIEEFDWEQEQRTLLEEKLRRLDGMEAKWRSNHEASSPKQSFYASSYSSWLSYGATFFTNVIENLQLKIRDVHFRYEDSISIPGKTFAFGATVESLCMQSCDDKWVPRFVAREGQEMMFKIVELIKFDVYWSTEAELLGSLGPAELPEAMLKVREQDFVINPVNAVARVKNHCSESPLRSRSVPRLSIEIQIDKVGLTFDNRQYLSVLQLRDSWENLRLQRLVWRWRPSERVGGNAQMWWEYAINVHREWIKEANQYKNWDSAAIRARDNARYVEAYKAHLINPVTLEAHLKKHKDEMEAKLPYDELYILRGVAIEQVEKESATEPEPEPAAAGQSTLQRWFPLWSGWYSSEAQNTEADSGAATEKNILEEELLDALAEESQNKFEKDSVLTQLNFLLKQGNLTLYAVEDTVRSPALEFEFETVKVGIETRPRYKSASLRVSLGSLVLYDRLNTDSVFPKLIAPPGKDGHGGGAALAASSKAASLFKMVPGISGLLATSVKPEQPLFLVTYEWNPTDCPADYRLHAETQSLDIVYNPGFWKKMCEKFHWSLEFLRSESSRRHYETLKEQTKQQIQRSLDGQLRENKLWDIRLDITAPQIIVPEHFRDINALLVIIDFGRFKFSNQRPYTKPTKQQELDSDDEDFQTPCSTPTEMEKINIYEDEQKQKPESPTAVWDISEEELTNKIYEKYTLELNDMQVLVGRVKDNWKFALLKGYSTMHILDRFSISLLLERRIVDMLDPQYPAVRLSANLQKLVVHLNEEKLQSLAAFMQHQISHGAQKNAEPVDGLQEDHVTTEKESRVKTESSAPQTPSRHIPEDACQLLVQFALDHVSFEVQSRGRSVCELQLTGLKSVYTQRFNDQNLLVTLHSLLLVDALQNYGQDYELLIASHRNVSMDSVSGSMKDSDTGSPTSPMSPASPRGPGSQSPPPWSQSMYTAQLLTNRASSPTLVRPEFRPGMIPEGLDSDALITLEVVLLKPADGSNQPIRIVNGTFNNLDIIANQETIVELVGFAKRVMSFFHTKTGRKISRNMERFKSQENVSRDGNYSTDVTIDFHRLGVLMLRATSPQSARKIATLSVSDAKIQANLGNEVSATGSLGGLQLVEVGDSRHQRILSVGVDPAVMRSRELVNRMHQALYPSHHEEVMQALEFQINRFTGANTKVEVELKMASVCYVHSPRLLNELRSCATEFKLYMADLAASITAAATEMAMGLLQPESGGNRAVKACSPFSEDSTSVGLRLTLETPVVVLPQSSDSSDVLVAHLGAIRSDGEPLKSYCIDIRDINLYSLNMDRRPRVGHAFQPYGSYTPTSIMSMEDLYSTENGKPILHNTRLELNLERQEPVHTDDPMEESSWKVDGKVVHPVRISLSRRQYEQIMDTISNTEYLTPSAPAATTAYVQQTHIPVEGSFSLPEFRMELRADSGEGEQGIVDLSLRDLSVSYYQRDQFISEMQVCLHSLCMEDLMKEPDSSHRFLLSSGSPDVEEISRIFLSQSCPDLQTQPPITLSSDQCSLPDKLEPSNPFLATGTPMESKKQPRRRRSRNEVLVRINILLVNPKSPDFITKYNSMRRLVDVELNSLQTVLSASPWVVVKDFFGLGETIDEPSTPTSLQPTESPRKESINTEIELRVCSVSGVLLGDSYELARATVADLRCNMSSRDGDTSFNGSLRSVRLLDLSPHGHLYRERFLTQGDTALDFQTFRYGKKDLELKREYDMRVKIRMSSVVYVHTTRFYSEIMNYFNSFSHLQGVMDRIRRATSLQEAEEAYHGNRILLNINAGSPVILIPESSHTPDVLVVDLGQLTLTNKFCWSGSDGTISQPSCKMQLPAEAGRGERWWKGTSELQAKANGECLLDVMHLELINMDLYCAHAAAGEISTLPKLGPPLLKEKCKMKLQVERNLDSHLSHIVPDLSVRGTLSAVHCEVDPSQYLLVRGLLAYNLGEPLPAHINADSLNSAQDAATYQQVFTCKSFQIELVNVIVDLVGDAEMEQKLGKANRRPLAQINFVTSRLLYESYSDDSKDVDLLSQEILLTDTRYFDKPMNKRPNMFTSIVQPMGGARIPNLSQAEVHYRSTVHFSRFTILLNSMRLMGVFDWWLQLQAFITKSPTPQPEFAASSYNEEASSSRVRKSSAPRYHAIGGVLTKRAPITQRGEPSFEIKLNITDSELVVLEDASFTDSIAVILKSTAVVSYRPSVKEKPLSLNLSNCELFSCVISVEEETALSIIDPVTLNFEAIKKRAESESKGILELADSYSDGMDMVLQVSLPGPLCVRLSYHDMRIFMQILDSLPRQARTAREARQDSRPANFQAIGKLASMGFSSDDCVSALEACEGHLDEAALWLTQNASPISISPNPTVDATVTEASSLSIHYLEIRVPCLNLCVIDDCKDSDVPLIELSLAHLAMKQHMADRWEGSCSGQFSIDYYNRGLSGWEPFLEPWKLNCSWYHRESSSGGPGCAVVDVKSAETVNVNLTTTLIELYHMVKENWTQDYYDTPTTTKNNCNSGSLHSSRRRNPFVPYAIFNKTGTAISFTTVSCTPDSVLTLGSEKTLPDETTEWKDVSSGETMSFTYVQKSVGRQRHRDSHLPNIHKLVVKLRGYLPVAPITVDRVGTYWREARCDPRMALEDCSALLVFVVTLDGSARKLVTVRSSLLLSNRLKHPVQLKLRNMHSQSTASLVVQIPPSTTYPIPLPYVGGSLWVRPDIKYAQLHKYNYCDTPLVWNSVTRPGEVLEEIRHCSDRTVKNNFFRFCLHISRDQFPVDRTPYVRPAHHIFLLSPLTVVNFLPCDIDVYVPAYGFSATIAADTRESFTAFDTNQDMELQLQIENFQQVAPLNLSLKNLNFIAQIRMYDSEGRILVLYGKILSVPGKAIKVEIFSPYLIENKTGIPLVYAQEGAGSDAAGQGREHEQARSLVPFMFSFAEGEAAQMMVARLGKELHPDGVPQWCHHFHLEKGVRVRRLRVSPRETRPDWVYTIGIHVTSGPMDSTYVTLTPRFELHNRSDFTLQYAQRHYASNKGEASDRATWFTSMPGSFLAFHWPRIDLEQLLCVRIRDIPDCCWSGAFQLENVDSFHVNIRDLSGKIHFLRVEVKLKHASYIVMFSSAESLPPPFRIHNHSEIPITYYQTGAMEERLKSVSRPRSMIPYAFDEPLLYGPLHLTLKPQGGMPQNYDLSVAGETHQLTYENFIYIALSATFTSPDSIGSGLENLELVLDVPDGTLKVVLCRKEAGKRSQLWRMVAGQLQHEGSSPPRDPNKPHKQSNDYLVLDIAGLAPQPREYCSLVLRRPDQRRTLTQTWRFTEDGRLCCEHNNMYVQAKDGFTGIHGGSGVEGGQWQIWREVVLGPTQLVSLMTLPSGIPAEQGIVRQRLRPGSGFLSVTVLTDGPTRVLLIQDIKNKRSTVSADHLLSAGTCSNSQVEISFKLNFSGLGISLVNRNPDEELAYTFLNDIVVEYVRNSVGVHSVNGSVRNFQVDNQLLEAQASSFIYVSPAQRPSHDEALPAIQFTVRKMPLPTHTTNADIFKELIVKVKNMSLVIEEKLLLKLLHVWSLAISRSLVEKKSPSLIRRYYFSIFRLTLNQVRLSVVTSGKLPADLMEVKKRTGIYLIRFEDAVINLNPFIRHHPFLPLNLLQGSILEHYKKELKLQAPKIIGATDALGNFLGLVTDVQEGVSGLITDFDVPGLFKNVTHGLSNSAAKVAGSLSDAVGHATLDDQHVDKRERIRQSGSDHLIAGFKGLSHGLLGGVTSIFSQTYEGFNQDGVPGIVSGFGRGLVGTVTKPAVGVLDLASGAASAVRDTSRSSNRRAPPDRVRPPRLVGGPGGLLAKFTEQTAMGQDFLYINNNRDYSEKFIGHEMLRLGSEDLRALISDSQLRILSRSSGNQLLVFLTVHYSELEECNFLTMSYQEGEKHYLELRMMVKPEASYKTPRVRCDTIEIARKVALQVNYAKALYEEASQTLKPSTQLHCDD